MNGPREHAAGWFAKGDSDLRAARRLLDSEEAYDVVCFHAQQAAEKFMKAVLALHGKEISRTHNLDELRQELSAIDRSIVLPKEVAALTPYAVQLRYDHDFWPDEPTARAAVDIAAEVRKASKKALAR